MIIRFILRIVSVFLPVKKQQICFEAFEGRQIACNPYYIYKELLMLHPDWEYIWVYNKAPIENIHCVKYNTLKYVYALMTSNVYITNDGLPLYVPFRKSQMVLNTWHGGGAYKRVGIALSRKLSTKLHFKMYNKSVSWFISNNRIFTDIISESFLIEKQKFLPFGQPRNDLLFDLNKIECLNKKVREFYSISEHDFIIMYAPTFRNFDDAVFDSDMQPDQVVEAVRKRFNKNCVFFVRNHHGLSTINFSQKNITMYDVSNYKYMQELLCATDMLISDYSSCIWDYSFLYRPCILFTQDLSDYQERQNFYTPIETWGFPIAKNSEELIYAIESFDDSNFMQRMKYHHATLGSYEKGVATKYVCNLIMSHIDRL